MEKPKKETEKKMTYDEKVRILGQVANDMAVENVDMTIAMLEFIKQSIMLDYIVSVRERLKLQAEEAEKKKAESEEVEPEADTEEFEKAIEYEDPDAEEAEAPPEVKYKKIPKAPIAPKKIIKPVGEDVNWED